MKPRRTRAVPRLSLLGEQGADASRELTCNVLCVYPCYSLVRAGLYFILYTISDTMLKVQIKWRHGLSDLLGYSLSLGYSSHLRKVDRPAFSSSESSHVNFIIIVMVVVIIIINYVLLIIRHNSLFFYLWPEK